MLSAALDPDGAAIEGSGDPIELDSSHGGPLGNELAIRRASNRVDATKDDRRLGKFLALPPRQRAQATYLINALAPGF